MTKDSDSNPDGAYAVLIDLLCLKRQSSFAKLYEILNTIMLVSDAVASALDIRRVTSRT